MLDVFLGKLVGLAFVVFYLGGIIWFLRWCLNDAEQRGRSKVLVFVLVFLFFPIGWIIWLMCRPPIQSSGIERFVNSQKSVRGNFKPIKKRTKPRKASSVARI